MVLTKETDLETKVFRSLKKQGFEHPRIVEIVDTFSYKDKTGPEHVFGIQAEDDHYRMYWVQIIGHKSQSNSPIYVQVDFRKDLEDIRVGHVAQAMSELTHLGNQLGVQGYDRINEPNSVITENHLISVEKEFQDIEDFQSLRHELDVFSRYLSGIPHVD